MKPAEQKPQKIATGDAGNKAIRKRQEASHCATRTWTTEAAGLPCAIELADDGCWVVTIASATTSRRDDLTAAILEASGGLVSNAKALELAAEVKRARRQEN
ncbi:MAG TPA: hypothetical protein VFU51_06460 [Gaiellaceae bacterium]|nr:hypothetical protein [Gaiellaceae bacterium]